MITICRIFGLILKLSSTILLGMILAIQPQLVNAQATGGSFVPFTFTDNFGRSMPYRLFIPKNYDPQRRYALVVFLHGAGQRGTDNISQLTGEPSALAFALPVNQAKWPCFMLAPQCPVTDYWSDIPYLATNLAFPPNPTVAETDSEEIVTQVLANYSIDQRRVYITGLSMGGFGAWDAIARYPGRYAAAVPIAGGGVPSTAAILKSTRVWAFHSVDDPLVPVVWSEHMVAAMRSIGLKPLYTEYNGFHHGSWVPAYADNGLLPWLFDQKLPKVPELLDLAGGNQVLPVGVSQATLMGVYKYQTPINPLSIKTLWYKYSGPGTVTFADPTMVDTVASFSTPGNYILALATSDDAKLIAQSGVRITFQSPTPSLR